MPSHLLVNSSQLGPPLSLCSEGGAEGAEYYNLRWPSTTGPPVFGATFFKMTVCVTTVRESTQSQPDSICH